jgi:endonuclease/exonuclease/phosphatase family metal-dependent hydrolase
LIGGLTCWLGLIAWSSLSAGGVVPPAKSDPGAIRVLTWNILHGRDRGAPWVRCGWTARKKALEAGLTATQPEILCVQEALSEQVDSIAAFLPNHTHVGVGRDDGRSAGEYCAIFYDSRRFVEIETGTFWLEEPTDEPPSGLTLGPKRICTWARLLERASGRVLRVYNTHLYLTEKARQRAVRVILARIVAGDPTDALLVTGDFNAPPGTSSRRLFDEAGLLSSAELIGRSTTLPTYHFYGIRLRSLDEILCSKDWIVREHRVLDVKPGNTYPSDHFGVMADVVLRP